MSSKYFEKLKNPRWQKKRLEILERDRWTCTVCGRSDLTLHVHHGYYEGRFDPWDYDNETLHTVCAVCHDQADCLRRDIQYQMAKLPIRIQKELLPLLAELTDIQKADTLMADALVERIQEQVQSCWFDFCNPNEPTTALEKQ
jgi:hypothetical protein